MDKIKKVIWINCLERDKSYHLIMINFGQVAFMRKVSLLIKLCVTSNTKNTVQIYDARRPYQLGLPLDLEERIF